MNWYATCHRPLPWRKTSDPYLVWVSEVMLQQTQVKTVVPYYQKFAHRFPNIHVLGRTDLQDVLKTWEGLGYYARARNLHKASGIIVTKYRGVLPDDIQLLRKLPGIGEYIASAVSSIAFGQPFAAVDGNVKRVLARLNAIDLPVNRSTSNTVFKASAGRLLARKYPGRFNQAMMELGALVCTPKRPDCGNCPVKGHCEAFRSNAVDHYPKRVKANKTPQFHIATGVVCKGQKVLITRRKLEGLLGGLWEFPGGKIKKGETAEAACVREIKEEVNLKVKTDEHLTRIRHAYTHFKIVMDVFLCRYVDGRIRLNGPIDFQWIRTTQIDDYPIPVANHKFIPLLIERLSRSVGSNAS